MANARASAIVINGTRCDYTPLAWPFYRGVEALPVVLSQGAQKGAQYRAALEYENNTIEIISPSEGGAEGQSEPFVIRKVFVDRDVVHNKDEHTVTLLDARYPLSRFTSPFRFNVDHNGVYLKETAVSKSSPATLEFAVKKFEELTGLKFDLSLASTSAVLRDELSTDGKKAHTALGEVLEDVAHDLTVGADGVLYIVPREQATSTTLQSLYQYAWRREPGFLYENAKKHSAPEKIIVPYKERHEMRLVNEDFESPGRRTVGRSRDKSASEFERIPYFDLEQVYRWEGSYYTLSRLKIVTGFSLTESIIAANILSRNWEGTVLEQQLPLNFATLSNERKVDAQKNVATAKALIKVIEEDWRRLWQLKITSDLDAAWTDLFFGSLTKDGTLTDGSVKCPWVDFLSAPTVDRVSGKVELTTARLSETHAFGLAPFTPSWEDEGRRIIRLKAETARESLQGRIPGELVNEIKLRTITNEDREAASLAGGSIAKEYENSVLTTTRDRAVFEPIMPLEITMVGLKQFPNSAAKWTTFDHETDIDDADAGDLWTTVDDNLTANYKFDDQSKPANNDALQVDSKRRADAVISEYNITREGSGEALGTLLAENETPVSGSIESITINFGTETKPYVSTTVNIKNFTDKFVREATQRRRDQRRYVSRGKQTQ